MFGGSNVSHKKDKNVCRQRCREQRDGNIFSRKRAINTSDDKRILNIDIFHATENAIEISTRAFWHVTNFGNAKTRAFPAARDFSPILI